MILNRIQQREMSAKAFKELFLQILKGAFQFKEYYYELIVLPQKGEGRLNPKLIDLLFDYVIDYEQMGNPSNTKLITQFTYKLSERLMPWQFIKQQILFMKYQIFSKKGVWLNYNNRKKILKELTRSSIYQQFLEFLRFGQQVFVNASKTNKKLINQEKEALGRKEQQIKNLKKSEKVIRLSRLHIQPKESQQMTQQRGQKEHHNLKIIKQITSRIQKASNEYKILYQRHQLRISSFKTVSDAEIQRFMESAERITKEFNTKFQEISRLRFSYPIENECQTALQIKH